MTTITFTVGVGIRAPIEAGEYVVRQKRIAVSYPSWIDIAGLSPFELPKSLSTMFVVSWDDPSGFTAGQLQSKTYERHLPIYEALSAISELLLAYKLVRVGHFDGRGVRTVGLGDALVYFSTIDGLATGDLKSG